VRPPLVAATLPRGQRVGAVLRRGLRLRLSCDERCDVRFTAIAQTRPRRGRARSLGARGGTARLSRRTGTVVVRLPRRAAHALRRRLPIRLTVVLTAVDRAGNETRLRRTVELASGRPVRARRAPARGAAG
jgi:hypothetical protein